MVLTAISIPISAIRSLLIRLMCPKEAAFFSVGTNDLPQYTLAIERQNAKLGEFYEIYHPALVAHIAKAANKTIIHFHPIATRLSWADGFVYQG